jgi:hypothetical protein
MKIIKTRYRSVVTNYKNENRIEYVTAYINLERIKYCLEFGDVIRVCFSQEDYLELDEADFKELLTDAQ